MLDVMHSDYLNFISYASYRHMLRKCYFLTKNQNSLSIGHKKKKKEGNSTGKGKEMIKNENVRKNGKSKSIDQVVD